MSVGRVAVVADRYVLQNTQSFAYLKIALKDSGFDVTQCVFFASLSEDYDTNTPENFASYKEKYLIPMLEKHPRDVIVGFGNNALCALGMAKKPEGVNKMRGKLHVAPHLPCPVVFSISPSAVMREPHQEDGFRSDITFACRCMHEGGEDVRNEPAMTILDIQKPGDVTRLLAECIATGEVAYDVETTGLNQEKDKVVTISFCTGMLEPDGSQRVWYWAGWDKLVPRFSEEVLEEFRIEFKKLFQGANASPYDLFDPVQPGEYRMIAHHKRFDDWICEVWLCGPPEVRYDDPFMRMKLLDCLPGAMYDTLYMKWAVDNERPHGLKHSVAKYLGYPEYDALISERVKEIVARRGKVLADEEDFFVLRYMGHEPVMSSENKKTGKKNFKWPKTLDKKSCAYAMLDYWECRRYCCFDSLHTLGLKRYFYERIVAEDLMTSCTLRHIAHTRLLRAEQRGMLLDVKYNRWCSERLGKLIAECDNEIDARLLENQKLAYLLETPPAKKGDKGGFNPGSGPQVIQVLYGETKPVPMIDRKPLFRHYDEESVEALCEQIEEEVYGDYLEAKQMLREGTFDKWAAMDGLQRAWQRETGDFRVLLFKDRQLGLGGLGYDPPMLTKTGLPSVSRSAMLTLNKKRPDPLLDLILMRNKSVKLKNTFIDKIYACRDEWDLVRTTIKPEGTQSGRLSSSGNFNVQNLPKLIRGMFIARPGMILAGLDFKSAEVFTLAAYSGDPLLLEAIYAQDTHKFVASLIYEKDIADVTKPERNAGKMSVFLIVYGGGADKLADALGITKSKAQWIIDTLLEKFPGIRVFMNEYIELASKAPYYTYTAFGTRRSTKDVLSNDMKIKSHVQRYAANHPIQGSAGEMCVFKFDQVLQDTQDIDWPVFFMITVHDSMLFETVDARQYAYRDPKIDARTGKQEIVKDVLIFKDGEPVIDPETGEQMIHPSAYVVDEQGNKALKGTSVKWTYGGALVDVMYDVVAATVPFPPLDRVTYKCDLEVDYFWDGEPDLDAALDDERKGGFRFDLLPKVDMSPYELKNLEKNEDGEEFDDDGEEIAVLAR